MAPKQFRLLRSLALFAAWPALVPAQTVLTLEQAGLRKGDDHAPKYEGEVVAVRGTASTRPIERAYFRQMGIQDDSGHGLTLEGEPSTFAAVEPGDRVEAHGTISKRGGMPILLASQIEILSHGRPPSPLRLALDQLQSYRYLGVLVTSEGRIVDIGENQAGQFLLLGDSARPMQVFLPFRSRRDTATLNRFEKGDRVRFTGLASQYCPVPPYNRYFQTLIAASDSVVLVEKRWLIPPGWFLGSLTALGIALVGWWARERRMASNRRTNRSMYALGEEVLGAGSPAEILRIIEPVLPKLLNISGVRLHAYNRATNTLDELERDGPGASVPVVPAGQSPWGVVACFRNRTLLRIPDTRRSPFFRGEPKPGWPRAVMYVPLLAHRELLGILEIYNEHRRQNIRRDYQAMAQHLANQIALALRLMEEQSIREQLFRSERLAAAGQLISGVATELRAPLEAIASLSEAVAGTNASQSDAAALAVQAEKASEIVGRLLSFTGSDLVEARPVDICALLRNLAEFRRPAWKTRGFAVREAICPGPVHVLGSQGQLERVILNALVHAEQALAEAGEKTLTLSGGVLARHAVIEISHSGGSACAEAPEESVLADEGVCRAIICSHGGDIRLKPGSACRFEIELPLAPAQVDAVPGSRPNARSAQGLTVLVVGPDENARRALIALLGRRGCRAVPAAGAEPALEMAGGLCFDAVFCYLRLSGLNWLEFYQRLRPFGYSFVLLTEAVDPELSRELAQENAYVLTTPVAEAQFDRVLEKIASRGRALQSVG